MLSIRLSRTGKKKQPSYRVVVMDKRRDPWGKSLEILGHRNPRSKETVLKEERIKYWLDQGAQASNSVWNMLVDAGIVQGDKRGVTHISKKRSSKTKAAEEAKKEAEEAKKEKETATEAPAEEVEKPAEDEKPAE